MAEKQPARPAPPERASFEEAIERLESIVEDLEGGSLTLEESIARYEEGVRLSKRLTQTLDEAEKRIERLVQTEEGAPPATTPIDLEDMNGGAEPGARERPGEERPGPAARPERVAPNHERREAPASRATPAPREGRTPPRPAIPPDELPF